jgi:hypothetical protein
MSARACGWKVVLLVADWMNRDMLAGAVNDIPDISSPSSGGPQCDQRSGLAIRAAR